MDRCRVGDYLTDEVRLLRVVSVRQVGAFPSACKVIVLEDAIEFDVDDRGDRVYRKRSYPEQEVDELRLLVLDLHETPV